MGLKLKWFRRRITFEGIPSAPERSIRRKEQNTGITVIGVYRQSANFEDYVEPSSRSFNWEPRVETIKESNTSTSCSPASNNRLLKKRDVEDKITLSSTGAQHNRHIETPPEPTYSPPKPPVRRILSKTKSTPNLDTFEARTEPTSKPLVATQSVEVLNETFSPVEKRQPVSPQPRTTGIDYSQDAKQDKTDKDLIETNKTSNDAWKQRQPEFFNELLEKVNGIAVKTKHQDGIADQMTDDDESFDDIFQKVKAKPRNVPEPAVRSETHVTFKTSRQASSSSIEDIFEPRPPEYPEPTSTNDQVATGSAEISPELDSKPVKSILKQRAPPTPQQRAVATSEIPTPPPRSSRNKKAVIETSVQQSPPVKTSNDKDDDNDDDDFNWNLIERHRCSINNIMATQVNPEILQNAPASLQPASTAQQQQRVKPFKNTRAIFNEPSKTLRAMRADRQSQQPTSSPKADGIFLKSNGRSNTGAAPRDSDANVSEASA